MEAGQDDEQGIIQDLINGRSKATNAEPTHAEMVDVLPEQNRMSIMKYNFTLEKSDRPLYTLSFFAPDIYNLVMKEPHQAQYMNYGRYYWASIHDKIVRKLDINMQTCLKNWTLSNAYTVVNSCMQLLFNKSCQPMYESIRDGEHFDEILKGFIKKITNAIFFIKYIPEIRDLPPKPSEDDHKTMHSKLSANNYQRLKEVVIEYIKDLCNACRIVKKEEKTYCDEKFWDTADIYLYRGHNDTHFDNATFDHNDCIVSTSLRFQIAGMFARFLSDDEHKKKTEGMNDLIKNTVYIYRLHGLSNAIYLAPITSQKEIEVLLLPDDLDGFIASLEKNAKMDREELLSKVLHPCQKCREGKETVDVPDLDYTFNIDNQGVLQHNIMYITNETGVTVKVCKTFE